MRAIHAATDRAISWFAPLLGLTAFGSFVYNLWRYDVDSFRGDQWFWLTNLILPFENGQQSLFRTVTYEFEPLAHSHIPTFGVMVLNTELLGLDTTVDRLIGLLSLSAVFAICWRHIGPGRASAMGRAALAAIASIVFMSLAAEPFIWSLLQFQMLFIAAGVAYMWRFGHYIENPRWIWPAIAMPLAMVIGDAAGIAAVIAGLLYLVPLMIMRRFDWRHGAVCFASAAISVLVIGNLLRGQKGHGGEGPFAFAKTLLTDPVDPLHSFYLAISQSIVGLHHAATGFAPIRWNVSLFWFLLSVGLAALAVWALFKGGIDQRDHFPIMLIIATLFWTLGVVRSRVWFFGPEATMQQPRYGVNTTMLGIGILLILVNKRHLLERRQVVVGALFALLALANVVGSMTVTLDEDGERQQDSEIAGLHAYVLDQRETAPRLGLACSDWAPCLEAGSYLWAEQLGPFSDLSERPPAWYAGFRDAVYDRFNESDDAGKRALCDALDGAPAEVLIADIDDPGGLATWLEARRTVVPASARTEAARFTERAMQTSCLAFSLFNPDA